MWSLAKSIMHPRANSIRREKKEEVQELNNALEETALDSPGRGGDDEVDKEEDKREDK
jgi:hypothetical protein